MNASLRYAGPRGEPSVRLTGGALARANEMGIETIHISISHTDHYAVASAVAEGKGMTRDS